MNCSSLHNGVYKNIPHGSFAYYQKENSGPPLSTSSFYENYKRINHEVFEPPPVASNLFVQLDKSIANHLAVSSCYVCGGTNMGDQWPWEAKELMPQENFTLALTPPDPMLKYLAPKNSTVWRYCIARWGNHFINPVGKLACLGQESYNQTGRKTLCQGKNKQGKITSRLPCYNPFSHFPALNHSWYQLEAPNRWQTPPGLYWICRQQAYRLLPANWTAACVLGETLGYPVYNEVGNRSKRSVNIKGGIKIGHWKDTD
ncbi:Endogenous retrovirus group 3 member 1 Env polyprotein [Plecturocebus cupreus]